MYTTRGMVGPRGRGRTLASAAGALLAHALFACSSSSPAPAVVPPPADAAVPMPMPSPSPDAGPAAVPVSCATGSDVAGVNPPSGFCLRQFAKVVEPRSLVFAPNGDLFVAVPSSPTPGGAEGGQGAILVLSDDDHDGMAEIHIFANDIPDVQGLTLGGGYLYFTTMASVWRIPYSPGQRHEMAAREDLKMPASFGSGGRWTHGLARSVGGSLYASRGEYGMCGEAPGGEISQVSMGALSPVATGFRNPMYMRCHFKDELCAATELGEDLAMGAREKLILLHPATNYGFPCCYTTGSIATGGSAAVCATVTKEDASFTLSDTPFGFDWERGTWPDPYRGGLFVALHGSAYSTPVWAGARIVFAPTDPQTHAPTGPWQDFLGGFGPTGSLSRPADVTFSTDGRLFFADDIGGAIYWMAPRAM